MTTHAQFMRGAADTLHHLKPQLSKGESWTCPGPSENRDITTLLQLIHIKELNEVYIVLATFAAPDPLTMATMAEDITAVSGTKYLLFLTRLSTILIIES